MNFQKTYNNFQSIVNKKIDQLLPAVDIRPSRIHEAMRYSITAGGKRLRPILVFTGHTFFDFDSIIDPAPAAVAVECLHTYSLIHDDLPCMDNSNFRRGNPTCHIKFDEATAVLAGDALLTYSFQLISGAYKNNPSICCAISSELSTIAGSQKLIGGQVEDLMSTQDNSINVSEDDLYFINLNKTASLISSSLVIGALLADASKTQIDIIRDIGINFGLAFQLIDDILDVTSSFEQLGKSTGIDAKNNKLNYATKFGLDRAREKANDYTKNAVDSCRKIESDTIFLTMLIQSMAKRIK